MREHPQADLLGERRVAVHLAVDLELGRALGDQRERLRIFAAEGMSIEPKFERRQQRHLGRDAEAADLLGGEQRHLGDVLGVGSGVT